MYRFYCYSHFIYLVNRWFYIEQKVTEKLRMSDAAAEAQELKGGHAPAVKVT